MLVKIGVCVKILLIVLISLPERASSSTGGEEPWYHLFLKPAPVPCIFPSDRSDVEERSQDSPPITQARCPDLLNTREEEQRSSEASFPLVEVLSVMGLAHFCELPTESITSEGEGPSSSFLNESEVLGETDAWEEEWNQRMGTLLKDVGDGPDEQGDEEAGGQAERSQAEGKGKQRVEEGRRQADPLTLAYQASAIFEEMSHKFLMPEWRKVSKNPRPQELSFSPLPLVEKGGITALSLRESGLTLSIFPLLKVLPLLEELDVGGNNLSAVPRWFPELKNLKKLLMDHNQFRKIPEEIFRLPSLKILNLSHNLLENVPAALTQLEELKGESLEAGTLFPGRGWTFLEELDLSSNRLKYFPEAIRASRIILANNRFARIPSFLLCALIDPMGPIYEVDLEENIISPDDPNLAVVVRAIQEGLLQFEGEEELYKQLHLYGNPFVTEFFNSWHSRLSMGLLDGKSIQLLLEYILRKKID